MIRCNEIMTESQQVKKRGLEDTTFSEKTNLKQVEF